MSARTQLHVVPGGGAAVGANAAAISRRYRMAFGNLPKTSSVRDQLPQLANILEEHSRLLFSGADVGQVATDLAICAGWLRFCFGDGGQEHVGK